MAQFDGVRATAADGATATITAAAGDTIIITELSFGVDGLSGDDGRFNGVNISMGDATTTNDINHEGANFLIKKTAAFTAVAGSISAIAPTTGDVTISGYQFRDV